MTYAIAARERIMDAVVEQLATGKFVEQICKAKGMPGPATIYRWQREDPGFDSRCVRARAESALLIEQKLTKLAEDTIAGKIDPKAANAASNILTWIAKVRDRSRYGDKVELDGKLRVVPELELTLNGPAPKVIDVEPEDDDSN